MDLVFKDRPIMTTAIVIQGFTLWIYGIMRVSKGDFFGCYLIAAGYSSVSVLDWVYDLLKKSQAKPAE